MLAGLEAALAVHPDWRYDAAAKTAARCRELLEPLVEVDAARRSRRSSPSGRRPTRPSSSPRFAERDVVVRELPGRNLVRASCGWWTSEDDLRRLDSPSQRDRRTVNRLTKPSQGDDARATTRRSGPLTGDLEAEARLAR